MYETQSSIAEAKGDCYDRNAIESAARDLYQTAALFLGDENEALQLVEQTVENVAIDPCADGESARQVAKQELVQRTLSRAAAKWPAQLHPHAAADLGGCVDTNDLSASGVTREQLDSLLGTAAPSRMRQWLEGLGPMERIVFVLRAVLGRSSRESTEMLQKATSDPWTEAQVGGAYRAALCSLASSLIDATAH